MGRGDRSTERSRDVGWAVKARAEGSGTGEGAADTPRLGPGEGPEESGGNTGGAGGPHHHRAATVVLETIRVALGSQPYTLLRLQGPDMEEGLEQSSASSPQLLHLCPPPASSLITCPPNPTGPLSPGHKHPHSPPPPPNPTLDSVTVASQSSP